MRRTGVELESTISCFSNAQVCRSDIEIINGQQAACTQRKKKAKNNMDEQMETRKTKNEMRGNKTKTRFIKKDSGGDRKGGVNVPG